MTQPGTSDVHNLTSPSHSRRHSCYYISATTANDALASELEPQKISSNDGSNADGYLKPT